jgi:SAM-dependent methyltransferase
MKNVLGEEIFTSKKSKQDFYDSVYSSHEAPSYESFMKDRILGKDDYFFEVVLPFCIINNIKSVLDVGADHGKYAAKFIDIGIYDVTATEISPARTKHLRDTLQKYGYEEVMVACSDIESSVMANYDFIFLSDIVEHWEDYLSTWKKCIEHSKYMYALIPKEDSWNWSPDHTVRFDDEKMNELILLAKDVIFCDERAYDEKNSWYCLLVKGLLCQ